MSRLFGTALATPCCQPEVARTLVAAASTIVSRRFFGLQASARAPRRVSARQTRVSAPPQSGSCVFLDESEYAGDLRRPEDSSRPASRRKRKSAALGAIVAAMLPLCAQTPVIDGNLQDAFWTAV